MSRFALLLAVVLIAPPAAMAKHHRRRISALDLVSGATYKPEAFRIRSPFPCGVKVRVNCSYGPGCSPSHRRTNVVNGPNDHYALDLVRAEDPANGYNRAVVAVASGVVLQAGWARGGWSPYGKIVYVQHGFRDAEGHRYQSLYAHLNQVKVRPGQKIRAGMVIGTLGGSSRHRLGRLGPHLHFALYQDAKQTLGGGRAVLPEPLGAFRELRPGKTFISCAEPEPAEVAAGDELPPVSPPGFTPAVGGWVEDSD